MVSLVEICMLHVYHLRFGRFTFDAEERHQPVLQRCFHLVVKEVVLSHLARPVRLNARIRPQVLNAVLSIQYVWCISMACCRNLKPSRKTMCHVPHLKI